MVTITLPSELEKTITEQAQHKGTTPELLTLETLHREFLPLSLPPSSEETLGDFLGDFIGCIHSGELVPGGAQMATDSGKKFAAGMVKKRQEGKL